MPQSSILFYPIFFPSGFICKQKRNAPINFYQIPPPFMLCPPQTYTHPSPLLPAPGRVTSLLHRSSSTERGFWRNNVRVLTSRYAAALYPQNWFSVPCDGLINNSISWSCFVCRFWDCQWFLLVCLALNTNQGHVIKNSTVHAAISRYAPRFMTFIPQQHKPLGFVRLNSCWRDVWGIFLAYLCHIHPSKPISTRSSQTANWICSWLLINSRADLHKVRSFAYRTPPPSYLHVWEAGTEPNARVTEKLAFWWGGGYGGVAQEKVMRLPTKGEEETSRNRNANACRDMHAETDNFRFHNQVK